MSQDYPEISFEHRMETVEFRVHETAHITIDGEVVSENLTEHPAFKNVARTYAQLFDLQHDPQRRRPRLQHRQSRHQPERADRRRRADPHQCL